MQTSDASALIQRSPCAVSWYHGNQRAVPIIDPDRRGADGETLCLSGSVNVACRYGPTIGRYTLRDDATVFTCSLIDWMTGRAPWPDVLRSEGYSAVIVEADPGSFDFAAPTLFLLDASAVDYHGTLSQENILSLDDGHSFTHDPSGPGDTGWAQYVKSNYGGDETAALGDLSP